MTPATDDDITKHKRRIAQSRDFGASANELRALIARLDLEVACRKDDAERIKGLEDVIWRNVDPFICPKKDDAIVASCNPNLQHAQSCLLWKGPT